MSRYEDLSTPLLEILQHDVTQISLHGGGYDSDTDTSRGTLQQLQTSVVEGKRRPSTGHAAKSCIPSSSSVTVKQDVHSSSTRVQPSATMMVCSFVEQWGGC